MGSQKLQTLRLNTDVLIVGGGVASLVAAIEASKGCTDVVLICKKRVGRSGNTLVSASRLAALLKSGEDDPRDSEEIFLRDCLKAGRGINENRLVERLVNEGGERLREIEKEGVAFVRDQGKYVRNQALGHSHPRGVSTDHAYLPFTIRGLSIASPLRMAALQRGVRFIEKTPVARLLVAKNRVIGALAVDLGKGLLLRISAKAVVIAAGGGGRLFGMSDNTSDITGDSYALAVEAGAILRDMEFIQFFPTMGVRPVRVPFKNPHLQAGGTLRNLMNEAFLERYPVSQNGNPDISGVVRAISYEIREGRGVPGGIRYDLSRIPEEKMKAFDPMLDQHLRRRGIDYRRTSLIVSPVVHFFNGGVSVDEEGSSSIEGLFAAGEAMGGTHGAHRLGGNALTEAAVFGARAGRGAARKAREAPVGDEEAEGLPWPEGRADGLKSEEILEEARSRLRKAMWEKASVIRSKGSLESLLRAVTDLKGWMSEVRADSPKMLWKFYELRNMLLIAEALGRSALLREESRGHHFREDYPYQDDGKFLGNTFVAMKDKSLQGWFQQKEGVSLTNPFS